jgi:hypothetical protein
MDSYRASIFNKNTSNYGSALISGSHPTFQMKRGRFVQTHTDERNITQERLLDQNGVSMQWIVLAAAGVLFLIYRKK